MAVERERFYECEVKRRRVRAGGGYERFWKVKLIADALIDEDKEFRCKDCGGALKLFRRKMENAPPPHMEHKLKIDSEYCRAGIAFLKATDGRQPRMSANPVR
ncbi:MAG: hypothetical protein KGK08_07875 [Acidobacteriota bacterium]|nr:hypothetical protein [Acidobacteriota bacterium]